MENAGVIACRFIASAQAGAYSNFESAGTFILAAKALGKHLGRPKMKIPAGWSEIYTLWKGNEITAVEAMKLTGLKKSTFYKLVKLTEETFLE